MRSDHPFSVPIYVNSMPLACVRPEVEILARKIFQANGEMLDQKVHRAVKKINLIENPILPPPEEDVPLQPWVEARRKYSSLMTEYRKLKINESFRAFASRKIAPTPEQTLYYEWFEKLYVGLVPWQDIIKIIQSDHS